MILAGIGRSAPPELTSGGGASVQRPDGGRRFLSFRIRIRLRTAVHPTPQPDHGHYVVLRAPRARVGVSSRSCWCVSSFARVCVGVLLCVVGLSYDNNYIATIIMCARAT